MTKRLLLFLLAIGLCGSALAARDEAVRIARDRLKEGGFYFREVNGLYDSETAPAVARYRSGTASRFPANSMRPPRGASSGPERPLRLPVRARIV